MTSREKLGRNLSVLGSGVAVSVGIRFFQSAILARLLGVTEFGKLAGVLALTAIVSRLNDMGLPNAVAYYLRRSPGSLRSLLRISAGNFILSCVVSLVVSFAISRSSLPFAGDLRSSTLLLLALAGFLAVNTPTNIFPGLVVADGDYDGYIRLTNLDAILQASFAVTAILIFGASYLSVVAAIGIEQTAISLVYIAYLRRRVGERAEVVVRSKEAYSYGLRLQWGVIMKLLSSRADLLIIGAMLGARATGIYAVAASLRDLGLLPQNVYSAIFQNMVIDRIRDGAASDRTLILAGIGLQLCLSILMTIVVAIVLPTLLPLIYGSAFQQSVGPAVVLFTSIIFLAPAAVCWMAFNAKGKPEMSSIALTAGGIAAPFLTFSLIRAGLGNYGASLSSVITGALTFVLSLYFLQRVQHYRLGEVVQAWQNTAAYGLGLIRSGKLKAGRHLRRTE